MYVQHRRLQQLAAETKGNCLVTTVHKPSGLLPIDAYTFTLRRNDFASSGLSKIHATWTMTWLSGWTRVGESA